MLFCILFKDSLCLILFFFCFFFFFFNDTATTEIYTLSLHDALPIISIVSGDRTFANGPLPSSTQPATSGRDRKSTRLNSSHGYISYAVFCLKKKNLRLNIPCRLRDTTSLQVA